MRRHWRQEECPVQSATVTLRLKDGREVTYEVTEPDAARLLCDLPPVDVTYGLAEIVPPVLIEPPPPVQFIVTFGFRIGRSDPFLRVVSSDATAADPPPPAG